MANSKEEDFLNALYEIENKSNTNDISKLRKNLIFKHSSALYSLDNRNTCTLLDDDFKNITNRTIIAEHISEVSAKKNWSPRKFGLQEHHGESVIIDLICSKKPFCDKSENVGEEHFQYFLSLFNEKRNKRAVVEQKQQPLTKNLQTYNVKANHRITKTVDLTEELNKFQNEDMPGTTSKLFSFKTAREELTAQKRQMSGCGQKRKLGTRRGIGSKFISPMLSNESNEESSSKSQEWTEQIEDDRLKNIEPRMVDLIKSEIMDKGAPIEWNDIAGLEFAKSAIQEAVVWPMLRPDIFTGLRRPPKGILLFGPPGTGKTLIGKCVASQSKSTFFSISASSLTSKWVGDGEKMVRALFAVARCHQPAVIFIDEIDSLLSQRTDTEHESSRRIKTEFLIQLDGATTDNDEKLLVIGATNRPQELDEAARRRFVKRLYIPLPEVAARRQLVERLMLNERHELNDENILEIAETSDGYSGADMRNLCADASMGPVRSIDMKLIQSIQTAEVRPVDMNDFKKAFLRVKSSVSAADLDQYVKWNKTYGSGSV